MNDADLASTGSDEGFSPEEQAAMDAYERGEDVPVAQDGAQGAAEPAPAAEPASAPAPVGEAAAAPGEVVDPDAPDADDAEKNRGRFVRHGAFHQERERRKAVERERDELREKFARGDERLRLLNEALQGRQAPTQPQAEAPAAPTVPTASEDIFGLVEHLQAELVALKGGVQQETARQRQEREANAVVTDYRADLNRYAGAEPAFVEAFNFVVNSRAAEYRAMGVPEAQIRDAVAHDEFQIAVAARQDGVSAAERIYAIAQARGFAPKAPEPAPAPAPAAPQETPAEKAARTAAGQAGPGRSLSAAGGSPAGEVTLEMLAGMSEAEFAKFADKNPRRLEQLMGAAA